MNEDLEQIGIDAVDRFLETWNSRDPKRWAGSLNFPHVRPSPLGEVNLASTAADYIADVDFQKVIDTGWDHSEWDYKQVLHVSPSKIHVVGQWGRYNTAGERILTTPVVYICTCDDGFWGIQSRFGADYVDEDTDTTELMTRGLNLIQDFANQHNAGKDDVCAEMLNYPHFVIGAGDLAMAEVPEDFTVGDFSMRLDSLQALQTGQHSINAAVEITVSDSDGSRGLQGVVHINNRDGHLGIQAWSFLDPNEESD
ncbi:MAG: hypothetical protein HOC70_14215 [Gammaproteobacteria bacterium]|nr:hypothetical protein [Gammaproteobacteria bacterium]MBT7370315.1 hypothetical protein [Gammaproteobacteria bacterium]